MPYRSFVLALNSLCSQATSHSQSPLLPHSAPSAGIACVVQHAPLQEFFFSFLFTMPMLPKQQESLLLCSEAFDPLSGLLSPRKSLLPWQATSPFIMTSHSSGFSPRSLSAASPNLQLILCQRFQRLVLYHLLFQHCPLSHS